MQTTMTPAFQKELLKFLLQNKNCISLVQDMSPDVFQFDNHKLFIILLKKYTEKYRRMPTSIAFVQYLLDSNKNLKLDTSTLNGLKLKLEDLYQPVITDVEFLESHLVNLVQFQQMKMILAEYAPQLGQGVEVWEKMKVKIESTINLDIGGDSYKRSLPTAIFTDYYNDNRSGVYAHQTYLKQLNYFTSKGGFATPELIVILGLPKNFKTGLMINIMVHLALSGLNVFYADFENGMTQIRTRIKQALIETDEKSIIDNVHEDIVDELCSRWQMMGGSIWVNEYESKIDTARTVEFDMNMISKQKGYKDGFQAICWDHADIMDSVHKEKEKHNRIENTYHDIIRVHKRQEAFGFTASHTKQSAEGKFAYGVSDLSDSWGKAKSGHAAFYFTQDEEEEEANLARVGIVYQRGGRKNGYFYVKVDYDNHTITEVTDEEYQLIISEQE